MVAIESISLAPILLLSSQRVEQSGYRAPLSAQQMRQHMLSQLSLVVSFGPQFSLFGDDRQNVFAQRAVFFSSGDGGASGR
jgi:hypothetical protein